MINIILFSGADLIFVIKFNLSSKCKVCKQRLFLIQKFLFVRRKYVSCFSVNFAFLKITAGPSIPPAVSYTKRPQANSVESEQKEDWDKDVARKLGSTTVGSKSEMTASPLVGPERKKSSTIPSNNVYPGGSMARRNTYVCERTTDRYTALQNGKDSSLTEMSASSMSSAGSAVASAVPSARPRHQKSMSASGHPIKVTLPTIKDSSEAYRPG